MYQLTKAIYDLKQAPRVWFVKLSSVLIRFGFEKSKVDASLFVSFGSTSIVYVLVYVVVYVDDIVIIDYSTSGIQSLIIDLDHAFALKDMDDIHSFLGIIVNQLSDRSLFLHQWSYIVELLEKIGTFEPKASVSPMCTSTRLYAYEGELFDNPILYKIIVGELQYATLIRLDLTFVVNKVCQFMAQSHEIHWTTTKWILRYLKSTLEFGLEFKPSTKLSVCAFVDVDRISCPNDHQSTFGFYVFRCQPRPA